MSILSINGCLPLLYSAPFCLAPSPGGQLRCSPIRRSSDQPYDIDFCRKAASNLSINWGERDTQLYLMKFTGQTKSCCSICGSGDHYAYGCSLSALDPTISSGHFATTSTKCCQEPLSLQPPLQNMPRRPLSLLPR